MQDYIADIRKTYTMDFSSSDPTRKQIAVATYLIDRLALRAGNEKVNLRIFVPWSLKHKLISQVSFDHKMP